MTEEKTILKKLDSIESAVFEIKADIKDIKEDIEKIESVTRFRQQYLDMVNLANKIHRREPVTS